MKNPEKTFFFYVFLTYFFGERKCCSIWESWKIRKRKGLWIEMKTLKKWLKEKFKWMNVVQDWHFEFEEVNSIIHEKKMRTENHYWMYWENTYLVHSGIVSNLQVTMWSFHFSASSQKDRLFSQSGSVCPCEIEKKKCNVTWITEFLSFKIVSECYLHCWWSWGN